MSSDARAAIFESIRSHLAASATYDQQERALHHDHPVNPVNLVTPVIPFSPESFKQNLEAVNGHCLIVNDETEIPRALTQIITALQSTKLRAQHIAISDNPEIERLIHQTDLEIEELAVTPDAHDVFRFDVGITSAQAAIAETCTLVLDSTRERHRLVSLVPPVHIVIIKASQIRATLGDALAMMREEKEISPAITFITGPSRTADIELTLAIGVHGPQELYVIINGSN
jgi:L-lactate dehydrogenase complex protein LldG